MYHSLIQVIKKRQQRKRKVRRGGGKQTSDPAKPLKILPTNLDIQADEVSQEEDEAFVAEFSKNISSIEEDIEPYIDSCYDKEQSVDEVIEAEVQMEEEYYVVVDFEATCFKGRKVSREDREIIEFAAAMVNKNTLAVEDEFDEFIRPTVIPKLDDFCTELTSITQEDVDKAFTFPTVLRQFTGWLQKFKGKKVFCSWGYYDKNQLEVDCRRHNVAYPFDDNHVNTKELFSDIKGYKRKYGLSGALKRVKLTFEGTRHRGIDDVRNIVRVMRKILV